MTPAVRVHPSQREKFATDLRKLYDAGSSIRNLVARTGLSYGTVHNLLGEVGTTFRPRGGRHVPKTDDD